MQCDGSSNGSHTAEVGTLSLQFLSKIVANRNVLEATRLNACFCEAIFLRLLKD